MRYCLTLVVVVACGASLDGQMLVVDRGIASGAHAGMRVGRTNGAGFVADHFQVGGPGEVWIIDTIRIWASSDETRDGRLADVFKKVALYGGIEATAPTPGQPPQPECDCHNLMTIKSGVLRAGSDELDTPDVRVSDASAGVRQVDFQNLHWSVPGGIDIQFGVMGVAHGANRVWYNQVADVGGSHQLKVFDEQGKLEGPFVPDGKQADNKVGLNLQVWGHKVAPVVIRSTAGTIEAVLQSDRTFDASKADLGTLRLGPKGAAPTASRREQVDGHTSLVMQFRRADTGIQGSNATVCLTGRQHDGILFEGCDLVRNR